LALTSPTGGGRSVGIVRVRTKATGFFLVLYGLDNWRIVVHSPAGAEIFPFPSVQIGSGAHPASY